MGRARTEERLTSANGMEGKKVVGRPRTKVLDWMIQETDGGAYGVRRFKEIGDGQKTMENMESRTCLRTEH